MFLLIVELNSSEQISHSRPLFGFHLFTVNSINNSLKIASDWNRTLDLWCLKLSLCRLGHNHFYFKNSSCANNSHKIIFLGSLHMLLQTSVTRFGKIFPLCEKCKSLKQLSVGLFCILQVF